MNGTDGRDGEPGTDGRDGEPGTDGRDGEPGTDGRVDKGRAKEEKANSWYVSL